MDQVSNFRRAFDQDFSRQCHAGYVWPKGPNIRGWDIGRLSACIPEQGSGMRVQVVYVPEVHLSSSIGLSRTSVYPDCTGVNQACDRVFESEGSNVNF